MNALKYVYLSVVCLFFATLSVSFRSFAGEEIFTNETIRQQRQEKDWSIEYNAGFSTNVASLSGKQEFEGYLDHELEAEIRISDSWITGVEWKALNEFSKSLKFEPGTNSAFIKYKGFRVRKGVYSRPKLKVLFPSKTKRFGVNLSNFTFFSLRNVLPDLFLIHVIAGGARRQETYRQQTEFSYTSYDLENILGIGYKLHPSLTYGITLVRIDLWLPFTKRTEWSLGTQLSYAVSELIDIELSYEEVGSTIGLFTENESYLGIGLGINI